MNAKQIAQGEGELVLDGGKEKKVLFLRIES